MSTTTIRSADDLLPGTHSNLDLQKKFRLGKSRMRHFLLLGHPMALLHKSHPPLKAKRKYTAVPRHEDFLDRKLGLERVNPCRMHQHPQSVAILEAALVLRGSDISKTDWTLPSGKVKCHRIVSTAEKSTLLLGEKPTLEW